MRKRAPFLLACILAAVLLLAGCDVLISALDAALPAPEAAQTEAPALVALPEYVPPAAQTAPEQNTPDPGASAPGDDTPAPADVTAAPADVMPNEDGSYTGRDEVARYLYTYGRLPDNFITKAEARALGWTGGSLEPYAPGMSIGGDRFGNYEGLLPEKKGRGYTECDIDTRGKKSRGAKRIVYSNDGLIFYTGDHYESFTLLYGEDVG